MAKSFNTRQAHELVASSMKKSLAAPDGVTLSRLDPEGTHLFTQAIAVGETKACLAMLKLDGDADPLRCRFDVGLDEWEALADYPADMPDAGVGGLK